MHGKIGLTLLVGLFTVLPSLAAEDHCGTRAFPIELLQLDGCVKTLPAGRFRLFRTHGLLGTRTADGAEGFGRSEVPGYSSDGPGLYAELVLLTN